MRERASHVIQLSEEKRKLEEELKLMDERLKAAERRSQELKAAMAKDGSNDGQTQTSRARTQQNQ